MGAHPYWYIVPFEGDLQAALDALREREFKAGRYNPVIRFLDFPITDKSPSPGPRHASPEAAMEAAAEEGTRSILDIMTVAEAPDFCAAAPLPEDTLERVFGTTQPTRQQIDERYGDLFEDLERGQAVYVLIYDGSTPREVLFAGYSFD